MKLGQPFTFHCSFMVNGRDRGNGRVLVRYRRYRKSQTPQDAAVEIRHCRAHCIRAHMSLSKIMSVDEREPAGPQYGWWCADKEASSPTEPASFPCGDLGTTFEIPAPSEHDVT